MSGEIKREAFIVVDKRNADAKGTADEAIGRPGPWGENRYEKKDQPLDESVLTPPGTPVNQDKPVSTPVTRRDYATSTGGGVQGDSGQSDNETPGGDAG